MGLPGESIPIILEPLKLPEPAEEPQRDDRPAAPQPAPPRPPSKQPEPA